MKNIIILILCLTSFYSQAQKWSVSLGGGVGYDMNKYNERYYTNSDRGLAMSVNTPFGLKFGNTKTPYSVKLTSEYNLFKDLSITYSVDFTRRGIHFWHYNEELNYSSYLPLNIKIDQLNHGVGVRKYFNISKNNRLFMEFLFIVRDYLYSNDNRFKNPTNTESMYGDDLHPKSYQIVRYHSDSDYYNLLEVNSENLEKGYRYTQGIECSLSDKISYGINTSLTIMNEETDTRFMIWGWNNITKEKVIGYNPTAFKFNTIEFNMYLKYKFENKSKSKKRE